MKVALKSLGCRLNEAELQRWGADFLAHGHQLTSSADDADLIVVNTCAVTSEAVKKSRQLIRRSRLRNTKARLVISGCYPSLQPDSINQLPGVDLVVRNADKDRLVNIVKQRLDVESLPVTPKEADDTALFSRGRNRAFIKVQDGCRHRCTFCVVTLARGAERSRTIKAIIDEVNAFHSGKIREVVLTGVHIGGYGHDLGTDLTALIKTILAETDIPRLRLGSVEPWNIGADFVELFDNPRFMPHLHLPMQSGSDSVLRRMGRRCKRADFARLAHNLRRHAPDLNITTDIIAGFPGETEAEWRQTLDFCRETGFSDIHVFPYSSRAGTRAALLPDQLPAGIKKQRCKALHHLVAELKQDYMRRFRGRELEILVENDTGELDGQRVGFGYSANYLRTAITVSGSEPRPNEIVTALVTGCHHGSVTLLADALRVRETAERPGTPPPLSPGT